MVARDLSGSEVGAWTVLYKLKTSMGYAAYQCRCVCGTERPVRSCHLVGGRSTNCGCIKAKDLGDRRRTHGGSEGALYALWCGMKARCENPNHDSYHNYGGKGVVVCPEWRDDFGAFVRDMGARPSDKHSVERVDGNGLYASWNCRWATAKEQANNMSRNRLIIVGGEKMTMALAAERFGINYGTLKTRLNKGIAPDAAVLP